MLSEKQIRQLISENELLILQLEDLNEVIKQQQLQLDALKEIERRARQLQSKVELDQVGYQQLQSNINEKQKAAEGTFLRMKEMENELYDSIKIETKYHQILDEHNSLQANLLDTTQELEQAASLYKKIHQQKSAISQMQSSLDIAQTEVQNLKAELAEEKQLNRQLRERKF